MTLFIRHLLAVVVISLIALPGHAGTSRQLELLDRTHALNGKVLQLVRQKSAQFGNKQFGGEDRTRLIVEVQTLLRTESSPAVLARTALTIQTQLNAAMPDDGRFDEVVSDVLHEVWFGAISNIERIGGRDALVALADMERTASNSSFDGAVSLAVRKARAAVEQRMNIPKAKQ